MVQNEKDKSDSLECLDKEDLKTFTSLETNKT